MATQEAQGDRLQTGGSAGQADALVTQAKEQVQQTTQDLKGQASSRARAGIDSQSTKLAEQVGSLSEALRKGGEHLDGAGNSAGAKVARQAADHAARFARYLESSDSNRFLADAEQFARRQPWAAGGVGLVAGFVAARFFKASSEGRYQTMRMSQFDADAPLRSERDSTVGLPQTLGSGAR